MASNGWALILGASSGFGAAAARSLAKAGMNIFGVHLDRRGTMDVVDAVRADIEAAGRKSVFFNINASAEDRRKATIAEMKETVGGEPVVKVMLHSLAFGTLKPFIGEETEAINKPQMDMTLDVMAHSLVYWTQDLVREGLMGDGGKIFAMTSSGGERVFPFYGAVSAAKAALESHIRQLSLELSSRNISANCIRAGVTDTPALRKIPGNERLIEQATKKNPAGRLTTPEDVAEVLRCLVGTHSNWLTGNILGVDGGEHIVD